MFHFLKIMDGLFNPTITPSFVILGFLSSSATLHFLVTKNKSHSPEEAFKLNFFLLLHIKLPSPTINYFPLEMKASIVVTALLYSSRPI